MREWIKCSDRLPELSKNVLVYDPDFEDVYVGYYSESGWREYYGTSCGCCGAFSIKTTYWMELPEKPKEE